MLLINYVIAKTLTTGRMIPSATNSPLAEAIQTQIYNLFVLENQ